MKIFKNHVDYFSICIFLFILVAAINRVKTLPDRIPLHWNASGAVDKMGDKSFIYTGIVTGIFVFILLTILFNYFHSKNLLGINNSPGKSEEKYYQKSAEYLGGVKLALMLIPFSYTILMIIYVPESSILKFFILSTVMLLLISILLLIKSVQNLAIYKKGEPISFQETVLHYIGYYDPNDPRVLVDKKIGIGVTVNFATRGGKMFFLLFVFLPFLFLFLLGAFLAFKNI